MKASIEHNNKEYKIDFSNPISIAIPLDDTNENINAWYLEHATIRPENFGEQTMLVSKGASVNFNAIYFNPHSHITHTECVGHITNKQHSVFQNLKKYLFFAELITIAPEQKGIDFVITKKQIKSKLGTKKPEAIVIRTTPNLNIKTAKNYSNTNPPYLEENAVILLRELEIEHLLIDLPSVDKEKDNGELVCHNAFWNTKGEVRFNATITEFIYVPNSIKDGIYFLNLMIAPFENDATPSTPVLYEIIEKL